MYLLPELLRRVDHNDGVILIVHLEYMPMMIDFMDL